MKQELSLLLSLGCFTLSQGIFLNPTTAQVAADGTTNTTVDVDGSDFTIQEGSRAGGNLFHSFGEFSVPTGGSAFFNNAADIVNIFSRVTGGNISNIDGLLRANGGANLFLLNPAGIIFGRGARLDIGGSFFGTTADSILFPGGEFSATDIDNPPLLTINAPIGLNFRDNPGDIVNRSVAQNPEGETNVTGGAVGLQVLAGETLAIVGGNVLLDDGNLTAKGGHIEIGSITSAEEVSITEKDLGFALDYDAVNSFGDITIQNSAVLDTSAAGDGSINVTGDNIVLNNVALYAGINVDLGSEESEVGNIIFSASNQINISNNSSIFNYIDENAIGNAGDIIFLTKKLNVNNSVVAIYTDGLGNSGNLVIEARELFEATNDAFISNLVLGNGIGNAGEFTINTEDISITNGASVSNETRGIGDAGNLTINTTKLSIRDGNISINVRGEGQAGDLLVTASESINLDGEILTSSGEIFAPGGLLNQVDLGGRGQGGNLIVNTPQLSVSNGSKVQVATFGLGNPGELIINANQIDVFNTLDATNQFQTGIFAGIFEDPRNQEVSGGIETKLTINTKDLSIRNGAVISASTQGLGNGGDLNITTNKLTIEGGSEIQAITFGDGDAGSINIQASELIKVSGTAEIGGRSFGGIFASAIGGGTGNGGNLTINTNRLLVDKGAVLSVGNFQFVNTGFDPISPGKGAAGNLEVNARSIEVDNGTITAANANGIGGELAVNANSLTLENGASISAETTANTDTGGNINLNVDGTLQMRNNSLISGQATEGATGGNININTEFIVAFPNQNNDIIANAIRGNGGNINITAEALFGIEERPLNDITNDINASSEFGLDGIISISTPDTNSLQTDIELPNNLVESEPLGTNACAGGEATGASSFTFKGKGGLPALPTEPLGSDDILVGEQNTSANLQTQYPNIKPIKTNIGDIYPARGIIKTEDGQVILTSYPTDNINTRTPQISANCSS